MTNWKSNLNHLLTTIEQEALASQQKQDEELRKTRDFYALVAGAFDEIKLEVEKTGRRVDVRCDQYACALQIYVSGRNEFSYTVKVYSSDFTPSRRNRNPLAPSDERENGTRYTFTEIHRIGKERIIADALRQYRRQVKLSKRKKKWKRVLSWAPSQTKC